MRQILGLLLLFHVAVACVSAGREEQCANGIDDDRDSLVDCSESECASADSCQRCGNGQIDSGEACDILNGDERCTRSCLFVGCGDRILTPPEECDDGNTD